MQTFANKKSACEMQLGVIHVPGVLGNFLGPENGRRSATGCGYAAHAPRGGRTEADEGRRESVKGTLALAEEAAAAVPLIIFSLD